MASIMISSFSIISVKDNGLLMPGFNNSLDGGDCLHGGHYADDLAAN